VLLVLFEAAFKTDMRNLALPIVLVGGVVGDRIAVRLQRSKDRKTGMKTTIGTILLVLGIGIIAASLPGALRYVFQDSEVSGDSFALGFGAMFVAGGWSLRRSGVAKRDN
jgi:hypothetical protein